MATRRWPLLGVEEETLWGKARGEGRPRDLRVLRLVEEVLVAGDGRRRTNPGGLLRWRRRPLRERRVLQRVLSLPWLQEEPGVTTSRGGYSQERSGRR